MPESPRWLVTHGQNEQAERTVRKIEWDVAGATGQHPPLPKESIEVHPKKVFGIGLILSSMVGHYRKRSILALVLMIAQSFLYNSVFFTFGLVLSHFYNVPSERIGLYLLPLAIGNFCGPLFLGTLFDTVGRKAMIGTFAISGFLLLITAYLFAAGFLTPVTQTMAWFSIFFFASAAASSAYLTASEIFPLETRALAIACFYALGTAIGGSTSPLLFGWLIESGSAWRVSFGYVIAALLLLLAAGTELRFGVDAEGKPLESIADPLSS